MSSVTSSTSYNTTIQGIGQSLEVSKRVKKSVQADIKDTKDVKKLRERELDRVAYNRLAQDHHSIQGAKKHLLLDKQKLSKAYGNGFSGKLQKLKDILKFCWGPKATIRKEIRQLDSLQRTIERKMAKLDPKKFLERKHTLISQGKVEKKLMKDDLRALKEQYKEGVKTLKRFEAFAKMESYQDPRNAVKQFNSITAHEDRILSDLDSYRRIDAEMTRKKVDPTKVRDEMDILRMDISNKKLKPLRKELSKLREEIRELEKEIKPRKKSGYVGI